MRNCIFSGRCMELNLCSSACPALAQSSYLLERNGISMNNTALKMNEQELTRYSNVLTESEGKISSVIVGSGLFTNVVADSLTYCAVCEHWKGSQLRCTVYNLKFNQYIDIMQKTWSYNGGDSSDKLEQIQIWIKNASVLIISNLDFVHFKEFQSQTLLSLLQSRLDSKKSTIVVTPPINSLVGEGQFFARLTSILNKQKVGENL